MKLYNPFKLHVVQFADGTYAVRQMRRRAIIDFHWIYLTESAKSWEHYVYSYCKHKTYEDAFMALAKRSSLDDEDARLAKQWALGRKVTKVIA
jgi:hypothetical protein